MAFRDHPRHAMIQAMAAALVTAVRNRQADYYLWRGYYFHGPRIPQVGQVDGRDSVEIPYGRRPVNRPDSWADFDSARFNAAARLPFHVSLTPYEGPSGHGWVLTLELFADLGPDAYGTTGTHWVYQHHEGPEQRVGTWDEWYLESDEIG